MKLSRATLSIVLLGFAAQPAHANDIALPNSILTPGAVDPTATVAIVCNRSTKERRSVTFAMKAAVLAAYNVPEAESSHYEIDHLIPLAIGGSNALCNLWPQPRVEADEKDVLEVELQREVCHGLVRQAEAQREIAEDWTASYRRRVGGTLEVAIEPPATSKAPQPRSVGATIRRELRAWIARAANW